jgi:hypothetical protein
MTKHRMAAWVPIVAGTAGGLAVLAVLVLVLVFLLPRLHKKRKGAACSARDASTGPTEPAEICSRKDGARIVVLKSSTCGHCKNLLPVIDKLRAEGVAIEIVDAPSTFTYDWHIKNKVKGYPTICELQGKRVVHFFTGRRTPDAIRRYVQDRRR